MEQKKIEHITLHLMIFGTIIIIGVLARQTALHYGWDEFSSYLVLVVCFHHHGSHLPQSANGFQSNTLTRNREVLSEI